MTLKRSVLLPALLALGLPLVATGAAHAQTAASGIANIETVMVI
jgi:hypothetical protein